MKLTKQSLSYSLPLIMVWCSIWIFTGSDTFIIGALCPKEDVSYYNMAEGIVTQSIGAVTGAFSFAVFPAMISKWDSSEREDLGTMLGDALTLLLKYLIPAAVGLGTISFFVYGPILNASYNPNYEGSILVCMFALGQLVDSIFQTYAKIWNLEKKTATSAIVSIVSSVFNFLLSALCVWLFKSYLLAAAVTILTFVLRTIITKILFRKKITIRVNYKTIIFSTLSSIAMSVCVLLFLYFVGPHIWSITIGVIIGIAIFVSLMFLFKQMDTEKACVKKIFKRGN